MSGLEIQLAAFEAAMTRLWSDYLDHGPGRVPTDSFDALRNTFDSLQARGLATDGLEDDLRTLLELGSRCALRPEGLCFVSGEAGLVPRKDLHATLESALARLRERLSKGDLA